MRIASKALTIATFSLVTLTVPSHAVTKGHFAKRAGTVTGPVIDQDFPDPGLILPNGTLPWYAYSTSTTVGNVPYATSDDFGTWTVQGDALPDSGPWIDSSNSGIWAPDVRQIGSESYVMYYTGVSTADNTHCVGVATSSTPAGPFTPQSAPIICNDAGGGVIDASGFQAPGGARYVLWKVDGSSVGKPTPIYIQPVGADGFTLQGSATELITNGTADGGNVEAPSLVYWDGYYYLFFSSNIFDTLYYDVSYAVATSVTGPYTKAQAPYAPLLVTGDCGTAAPGGATVINVLNNYVNAVFHSDINGQNVSAGRAMWQIANLTLSAGVATISC